MGGGSSDIRLGVLLELSLMELEEVLQAVGGAKVLADLPFCRDPEPVGGALEVAPPLVPRLVRHSELAGAPVTDGHRLLDWLHLFYDLLHLILAALMASEKSSLM